jgi:hypothetical protein
MFAVQAPLLALAKGLHTTKEYGHNQCFLKLGTKLLLSQLSKDVNVTKNCNNDPSYENLIICGQAQVPCMAFLVWSIFSIAGILKAAVFPVPFFARASMSLPVKAMGILSSCIGDGLSKPFSYMPIKSSRFKK